MELTHASAAWSCGKSYEISNSLPDFDFISIGETQLNILYFGDDAVITFRGTDDIKDWFKNLKVFKTKYSDIGPGCCHLGFREAYDSVRHKIKYKLKNKCVKNVHIAGHSLGGALALLCALDLTYNHCFRVKSVHTFGCPRVFDPKMAKYYNRHLYNVTYRWVNNSDIVCRYPKIGYNHVGKLFYIDKSCKLHYSISIMSYIKDIALGYLNGFKKLKVDSLIDHNINKYLSNIKHIYYKV